MIKLDILSKSEAARYMGVKGQPDKSVNDILDKYEPIVREKLRPNYVYRESDIEFTENGVRLSVMENTLRGNDIKKHLKGCTKAVIFAATVSAEADKLIRQTAVTNMAESLAVDCLCSTAIEQLCDKIEEEIFSKINAPYRTWRFSAGYGDLPISSQKDFITSLNAQRRIGLTVTDNFLLIPSKSVTAIIGISENPPSNEVKKGCAGCNLRENCAYTHNGGCHRI
jgi:hypothetical protein